MSSPWPMVDRDPRMDLGHFAVHAETAPGWVYFLGSQDETRIKIGHSRDLNNRLLTHASGDVFGQGGGYQILALVQGHQGDEATVHRYFKEFEIKEIQKKEIFRSDYRLIDYIVWLRDQYFVALTIDDAKELRGEFLPSDLWLPDKNKRETKRREPDLFFGAYPWRCLPERDMTADDWHTPSDLIDLVRDVFGGVIDLDPASHVYANKTVRANTFFSKNVNGLIRPWYGNVWLNPPFSEWVNWQAKVLAELERDVVQTLICLAFTRTLTAQYFENLLRASKATAIFHGRIAFQGKVASDAPPDGLVMLCMKGDVERFAAVMQRRATVLRTMPR